MLPQGHSIVFTMMTTILQRSDLFPAAASAVERQIALGHAVVDVRPLVAEIARDFPRHQPQELSAAIITAIALRGAAMQWQTANVSH